MGFYDFYGWFMVVSVLFVFWGWSLGLRSRSGWERINLIGGACVELLFYKISAKT